MTKTTSPFAKADDLDVSALVGIQRPRKIVDYLSVPVLTQAKRREKPKQEQPSPNETPTEKAKESGFKNEYQPNDFSFDNDLIEDEAAPRSTEFDCTVKQFNTKNWFENIFQVRQSPTHADLLDSARSATQRS